MGYIVDKEFVRAIETNIISAIGRRKFIVNRREQLIDIDIDKGILMPMIDYHNISSIKLMLNEETMSTTCIVRTNDPDVNVELGEDCYCAVLYDQNVYKQTRDILEI